CPDLPIKLILGQSREAMCASDAVLLASGTATLEAMLLKKPMLVAYKVSDLSYAIYRRLIKLKYFSLPNLLTENPLVPELIQSEATTEALTKQISTLLETGLSQQQQDEYLKVHHSLQLGGGEKAVDDLTSFFKL
ncbi:MAG: lipid-A-disaccharide synthase, partial [Gammaproteobacteria bacterium]